MPRRAIKLTPLGRRLRYGGRKSLVVVVLAAVASLLYFFDRQAPILTKPLPDYEKYHNQPFRVARVVDGDTIDLDVSDGKHPHTRVRLWGVDTPETVKPNTPVQHYGKEASQATDRMCMDKIVRVELLASRSAKSTRDKYGRLLAYIYLDDGRMLNRVLVQEGYAYADPRFPHPLKEEFLSLQDKARQGRVGLWRDAKESDLPYYWHKKIHLEN